MVGVCQGRLDCPACVAFGVWTGLAGLAGLEWAGRLVFTGYVRVNEMICRLLVHIPIYLVR